MKRQEQLQNLVQFVEVKDMRTLRNTFLQLAANPKPLSKLVHNKDMVNIYITQESIVNNFEKVFGYRNETLALRFYNLLSGGFKGVHIYIANFIVKLQGLFDGTPLKMNIFGFKLLDSEQKGKIYASDISDIIHNGLDMCPEICPDKHYPDLVGLHFDRSISDKRCRCALYQEMLGLYNVFFEMNKRNVN